MAADIILSVCACVYWKGKGADKRREGTEGGDGEREEGGRKRVGEGEKEVGRME